MKSLLKKNVKQDYTIEFRHVKGLNVGDNVEVVLKWRRGDKKENKGAVEKALVHGGEILYSPVQTVHIHCTLFLTKNGYEEKGLEITLNVVGKKTKELCKGYIDLAKYADLNGVGKDLSLQLKGKFPATVDMKISSLLGEAGGSSDETEVLQVKTTATTDIHELLVQQVSKKHEDDEKAEDDLEEKQRKQKEIAEREEAERQKRLKEEQKNKEAADIFAAASSKVKIKGKKEKDTKKKFTQEDVDKACEKAIKEALKAKKEKYHKIKNDLEQQIKNITESMKLEKENAVKEKQNQIDELNSKIAALEEEVKQKEQLKVSLEKAEINGQELKEVIEKVKIEREEEKKKVEKEIEELKKEKKEEEEKKEDLKKQLEEEQKEKESIKVTLATSENYVVQLKAEVEKKESEKEELKKKDEEEKLVLKKKIEETERNAAAGSEQIINQKNTEIEQIKNEKEHLVHENEELKKTNKKNEEVLNKQQNEINSLKKRIEEEENGKGDDAKIRGVLSGRIEELTNSINDERERFKEMEQKSNKEIDDLSKKLKEMEELLGAKEEEVEKENKKKEEEIEKYKQEIEVLKNAEKESSSSVTSEDEGEEKTLIIGDYEKSGMKYNEKGKPIFGEELKKYLKKENEEELEVFEIIRNFGECSLENALYLLNSIIVISKNEKTEKVKRNNTLKNQIMEIQYSFFIKAVQIACSKLNGFIESVIKDNQCFERRRAAEYEQITATYIVNYLREINKTIEKNNTNVITQKQLMIQIVHYLSYYVIDILIENDQLITCAKGLQLKFLFSIMDAELSENKLINYLRDYLQPAIEISGLLVLDHSKDHFDVKEMKHTFPHLSGSVIYALLSRFKPDNLNKDVVDEVVLNKIDKNDCPIPKCLDLIKF